MVQQACDRLPPRFQRLLSNVAITVEDRPRGEEALGFYQGTPIGERGTGYSMVLPDKISIYRLPLLAACSTQRELQAEIELTVLHEIGHHFGMDDAEIPF
jgi:predicted Zn-dependent protease with MMP-like domain